MKVVVIDNDRALIRSLEIFLSTRGHQVIAFDSPTDACAFLQADEGTDVLILDFLMPELTGADVLQRIKKRLPKSCKIILISGHTDLIEPIYLESIGVHAFLPKPLDIDQLTRVMEKKL